MSRVLGARSAKATTNSVRKFESSKVRTARKAFELATLPAGKNSKVRLGPRSNRWDGSLARHHGLLEGLDEDATSCHSLNRHLIAVEEAHTKKRIDVRSVYRNTAGATVPDDRRFINVEQAFAAIGEKRTSTATPRQIEGENACGRQGERPIEAGVDHCFDFLFLPCRTAYC